MANDPIDFGSLSLPFLEGLYQDYLRDPTSVPEDWRAWFASQSRDDPFAARPVTEPSFRRRGLFEPRVEVSAAGAPTEGERTIVLQDRVDQMIHAYRVWGHKAARLDPLGLRRPQPPELDPSFYGLTEADMEREFSARTVCGPGVVPLREILACLRNTYCRYIGVQYMHIDEPEPKRWLQERMELTQNRIELSRSEQRRILTRLTDAAIFEEFLQKKYVGAKSFSLEGAESLIPLLDLAIEHAGGQGIEEIVLGMPHRGRLNVLANIMGKSPKRIFQEFEDIAHEEHYGAGDVKYHLGHSNDWETASGARVHLSLCFNPSHLEYVNPVAMGRVRAKQDRRGDALRRRALTVLLHGDAAFAGEGVVQETLNLSQLDAYTVGGTLHVIVNNQIGFTTSPSEARSMLYAADVARMLRVPIFHVNGEDPEAVAQVIRLALDFRRAFERDVVVEMFCYRRRGHNEGDEPAFTQPILYKAIREREPVLHSYTRHLLRLGGLTEEEASALADERRQELERELSEARSEEEPVLPESLAGIWSEYRGGPEEEREFAQTGVARERLVELLERMTSFPQDFQPHPKIVRGLERRREMATGERPVDWASAEALAFCSLAAEGHPVRMTGQDAARGTFSQRHAMLHDAEDGRVYEPFRNVAEGQAPVAVYNSPLSEAGVLGFEYGYSLDTPEALVLWEAQFGDFVNAAQVIIDQFIASAEDKWQRLSGLVLLLPHGFEGQGPEHSSARLERFLLQGAEDNLQIVYPTTPAQYFHLLRRQVVRRWRKPLVAMTPKSLLRHPEVVSELAELEEGRFRRVLPDPLGTEREVERILLCSGKVYYDLEAHRREEEREEVAILRLEQLYPLSAKTLRKALAPYPDDLPVLWVQEEPENMGAWRYMRARFGWSVFGERPFHGVTRRISASPATGSSATHKLEQQQLVQEAFGPLGQTQKSTSKEGIRHVR